MITWTISKKTHWEIYADGKAIAKCNSEEGARMLLISVQYVEQNQELLERVNQCILPSKKL